MGVLAIWRYPVKAMLGESLPETYVDHAGCDGDRKYVAVDVDTGETIANKRGPTHPALRACRAALLADRDAPLPLRVTLPDGEVVEGADIEPALSSLLGRRVRLQAAGDAPGRFAAPGRHQDFAPVHVLTTRTLAHLRALQPEVAWDPRRFRPNFLLDDGDAPGAFSEDALLGRDLRGPSGLALAVGLPTPRCVVVTRAHEELAADPRTLRTIAEHHEFDLGPFGRHACAGAYAETRSPGRVRVGEVLIPDGDPDSPSAAIATSLARVQALLAGEAPA
ncbi:MOSC domain-containing protein [Nannocystis sp. RBIL2]|uniref:MOSC domain-containing protein n=1 Tax=Nannocystis sp. RBIL2 TaxID=2996788 RepID=UPI0022710015|nr:MOSC N-terminal beta barrel domain-containing protein [Nannocystis sp. RBIL2]MCY1063800.1 MOSC domain-containing protein [Nannocystis sp. RBIL2]